MYEESEIQRDPVRDCGAREVAGFFRDHLRSIKSVVMDLSDCEIGVDRHLQILHRLMDNTTLEELTLLHSHDEFLALERGRDAARSTLRYNASIRELTEYMFHETFGTKVLPEDIDAMFRVPAKYKWAPRNGQQLP